MPRYKPNDEELDPSYGGKPASPVVPPESGGEPGEEAAEPKQSVDEENAEGAEILIAKNKLPDVKEGDECTFKVTKDFGDEFSLEYVKEAKPEEDEPQTNDDNMASVGSDFAAMAGKE